MLFKLIDHTGPVFRAVKFYKAAGFIPSVTGHTLDGKLQTTARMEDIDIIPDTTLDTDVNAARTFLV